METVPEITGTLPSYLNPVIQSNKEWKISKGDACLHFEQYNNQWTVVIQ